MLLHDSLDEAVADVSADLRALVDSSRTQGRVIRRRRRGLAAVGAAAAVAVVATSAYALVPTDDAGRHTATDPVFASPFADVGPLSGRTDPITGRGVVAALASAVDDVADGTYADLRGSAHHRGESTGEFLFKPAAGGPAALVHVDLQKLAHQSGDATYTCDEWYMHDCAVERLPGGDTLRTYTDEDSGSAPTYRRYVAEVLSPARGLRLVLGAVNTAQSEKETVRAEPVLNTEQLVAVASRPWWDLERLPREYVDQGDRLASYDEL